MTFLTLTFPNINNGLTPGHKKQTAPVIIAELTGSNRCKATGVAVTGQAPVLKLCRSLIAAGLSPDCALEVLRGAALALRVRSLRAGAALTVKEPDRGRVHFAQWNGLPSSPVPLPMRKNGRGRQ